MKQYRTRIINMISYN